MTLLLNLVGPQGIHQSSDYRLTDVSRRTIIEDTLGSKQVHHLAGAWSAQVSFTGFASIGSRKTRDWISEVLRRSGTADAAMRELAASASRELRHIPLKDWFLTIVVTLLEKGPRTRLFVISCFDRLKQPPLSQPLDHFEVIEVPLDTRHELIFGHTQTVTQADRKFLSHLNKGTAEPAEIRRALAAINSRSAKLSGGTISEGCFVASTMPDGSSASHNFGRTPGVPLDFLGSPEMLRIVERAQNRGRPVIVQGREARAENTKEITVAPMDISAGSTLVVKLGGSAASSPIKFVTDSNGNTFKYVRTASAPQIIDEDGEWRKLEEGMSAGSSRRITFSSPSSSYNFYGPNRTKHGFMEIIGTVGDVVVVKNRVAKIILGTLKVHALEAFEHQPQAIKATWDMISQPTIDGTQPHGWDYTVDMLVDSSGGSISIRQNSVALRHTELKPMSSVENGEELVVVSSTRPSVMKISRDQPSATGVIEARLLLRDVRQPAESSRFKNS